VEKLERINIMKIEHDNKLIYEEPWKVVSENNFSYLERIKNSNQKQEDEYLKKMQEKISDEKILESLWSKLNISKGCYVGAMKSPSGTLFYSSLSTDGNSEIPEITINIESKNVIASSRILKAKILSENSLKEIELIHGPISDLPDFLIDQVAAEIDHELFSDMINSSIENNFVDVSNLKEIKDTVIKAAAAIYKRTCHSSNIVVFTESKEIFDILSSEIYKDPNSWESKTITVEHFPLLPKDKIILAQRGDPWLRASMVMHIHSICIYGGSSINDPLFVMFRYYKELLNPKAFHSILIK